jgi:hypothetical protein
LQRTVQRGVVGCAARRAHPSVQRMQQLVRLAADGKTYCNSWHSCGDHMRMAARERKQHNTTQYSTTRRDSTSRQVHGE